VNRKKVPSVYFNNSYCAQWIEKNHASMVNNFQLQQSKCDYDTNFPPLSKSVEKIVVKPPNISANYKFTKMKETTTPIKLQINTIKTTTQTDVQSVIS